LITLDARPSDAIIPTARDAAARPGQREAQAIRIQWHAQLSGALLARQAASLCLVLGFCDGDRTSCGKHDGG
jgi:hypothetical protein